MKCKKFHKISGFGRFFFLSFNPLYKNNEFVTIGNDSEDQSFRETQSEHQKH